jgi:hypothetical protein
MEYDAKSNAKSIIREDPNLNSYEYLDFMEKIKKQAAINENIKANTSDVKSDKVETDTKEQLAAHYNNTTGATPPEAATTEQTMSTPQQDPSVGTEVHIGMSR